VAVPDGFVEVAGLSGFALANGPWYERERDDVMVRGFRAEARHANTLGIVHGGMLAAFLDSAMGMAVWRGLGRRSVSLRLTFDYLLPVRVGDWIEATAEVVASDGTLAQARGRLRGPRHEVLTAAGNFALLKPDRPPRAGQAR